MGHILMAKLYESNGEHSAQVGIITLGDEEIAGMLATEAELKVAACKLIAERVLPEWIPASKGNPHILLVMKCAKKVRQNASDYWHGNISYTQYSGGVQMYSMDDMADGAIINVLATKMPYDETRQEIIDLIAASQP
jgi:hypothetical protein